MSLQSNRVKDDDNSWRDNIKTATNPRPKDIVMNKKITVQELHQEIQQVKDNHLAHMAEDIDELKEAVRDNREFFIGRLDRLDNRLFWILGLAFTTLLTVLAAILGGM